MMAPFERPTSKTGEIEIRHCESLAEYETCVELELQTWGEQITVPSAIFVVAHHSGGQILGAFDGDKMVGFTLSLAGIRGDKAYLHSHMTAVLPEYQNRAIARRLKLFQREDALKRGIQLIEWTFDPLELKNAHFNLVRLGAIIRRFIPNCYGLTDSALHAGLPTDRLVAEWWIDSDRVKGVLAGAPLPTAEETEVVALPTNLSDIKTQDHKTAINIQAEARKRFQELFHRGYIATGLARRAEITEYVLEPAALIAGLRLPEYRPEEFED